VIEARFLSNSESRVLQLNARFHAIKQGDLSISNYYRRMKGMADDFVPWVRPSPIVTLFLTFYMT
jgi:hypothetical protein